MRTIVTLSLIFFLVLSLTSAGCGTATKAPPVSTATPSLLASPRESPTSISTPTPTLIPTPVPTEQKPTITDGFWCRDTTVNIGKAPTSVKECYQFFPDMTYKWGYAPGHLMGKSLSCSGDPAAKCVYFVNGKGQYEIEGGYAFIFSGDTLIDPHNPPYFTRSETGIP